MDRLNCEELVECIGCGELIHPDDAHSIQKAADAIYEPLCDKCFKEAE